MYPGHCQKRVRTVFGQSRGSWECTFGLIPGGTRFWLQTDQVYTTLRPPCDKPTCICIILKYYLYEYEYEYYQVLLRPCRNKTKNGLESGGSVVHAIAPTCAQCFLDVSVGWSRSPRPLMAHSMRVGMLRGFLTACGCIQETNTLIL